MMLRTLYSWLLRLHPEGFRKRFTQEMLSIFDQVEKGPAAAKLMADALLSLVRQWTLRSEYWKTAPERVPWSADGAPVFYTLESFKPRRGALYAGGIITLMMFCVGCLDLKYDWRHPAFIPFRGIEFADSPEGDAPGNPPVAIPEESTRAHSRRQPVSPRRGTKLSEVVPSTPGEPLHPPPGAPAAIPTTRARAELDALASKGHPIRVAPSSLGRAVAPAKIPEDALQIYPGAYVTDAPNEFTILITAEDGELAIEIPGEPKSRLVHADGTRFVFPGPHNRNGNWIEFLKHDDGTADELRIYQNGRHSAAHRKP
jgi:hypothetical protein